MKLVQMLARTGVLCLLSLELLSGAGPAEQVRSFNSQLAGVPAGNTRAASDQLTVLRLRAAAFQEIIRTDPAQAFLLELPAETRARLASLPQAANFLETDGTWSGDARTSIEDGLEGRSRRVDQLVTGTETLDVHYVSTSPRAACGQTADVQGVRLGNAVAAQTFLIHPAAASDAATGACSSALGDRPIAVILLSFPSNSLPANAAATAQSVFFGAGRSVAGYWRESSYGKASASGSVFGPFVTDKDYSCGDATNILTAGLAAAQAAVNFGDYAHIYFVFPQNGGCAVGTGSVGCWRHSSPQGVINSGFAWIPVTPTIKADELAAIAVHEGGHNMGLEHAGTLDYGTETLGPPGSMGNFDEYGDRFSTMGIVWSVGSTFGFGHYAAPHKSQLGWLQDSANVKTVQTSGSYSIYPYEAASTGVQALRVRRGTDGASWLWIEYRRPGGAYDPSLGSYSGSVFNGALVHYDDPSDTANTDYTKLLTFHPNSFNAAPLTAGESWSDTYSNLSLRVDSATADALSVTVTYVAAGAAPRLSAAAVSAADGSPAVAPGGIMSIYGAGLASALQQAGGYPLPTSLAGTSVEVVSGGVVRNAPLYFVSAGQINTQLPFETAGPAQIRVRAQAGVSLALDLPYQAAAPRLFTTDMTGKGNVAALRYPDYGVVGDAAPVRAGDTILVFATGLGSVSPPAATGAAAGDGSAGRPLSQCDQPVTAVIGGLNAQVLWAGLAPGFSGLYQVNLTVPAGIASGTKLIVVQAGGVPSQSGVTVPITR